MLVKCVLREGLIIMRTFRRRNRRGQALVEMAILFPFFLLVVVGGIIDFGFAFYNLLTLQQINDDVCMRLAENTRYIPYTATSPDTSSYSTQCASATSRAYDLKPKWWTGEYKITISPTPVALPNFPGHHYVAVAMEYKSQTYTPFYQALLSSAVGNPSIGLASRCVYKIPRNLVNR